MTNDEIAFLMFGVIVGIQIGHTFAVCWARLSENKIKQGLSDT